MHFCYHTDMNVIKSLELLAGMLAYDKASILLVHGGLKPSAQVVMEGKSFRPSSDTIHIDRRLIDKLDFILSEMKLPYIATYEIMEARSNDASSKLQEVMRIYVAPSKKIANQLKTAFDSVEDNHSNVGALLGYPITAVRAFLTPDMLDWDDHPISTEKVSERNMRLLGHRLSKANWRDEVRYLEASGNYLKKVSPKIYKEITKK